MTKESPQKNKECQHEWYRQKDEFTILYSQKCFKCGELNPKDTISFTNSPQSPDEWDYANEFRLKFPVLDESPIVEHLAQRKEMTLWVQTLLSQQRAESKKGESWRLGYQQGVKETIEQLSKEVMEIIDKSKATFFVSRDAGDMLKEQNIGEAVYEMKAEISNNVGMYFYELKQKS